MGPYSSIKGWTVTDMIDDIVAREGGYSNDPADAGGRTDKGISEKANPEAWADGVVTDAEAREIYERKYVKGPGFDQIRDRQLRAQLTDFGVNSGPMIAIMKLQEILHVKVDGILGPQTLTIANSLHADDINTSLVAMRVRMIGKIVTKNPSQLKWLNGWLDRALQFLQ